jgi:urea transport system substrate-binding protein
VAVVFGGWTSASRKAMLPVFEAKNHMLFYPIQYEGQECSRNIFYTGAVPNQQAEPAVDWLMKTYGDKLAKRSISSALTTSIHGLPTPSSRSR